MDQTSLTIKEWSVDDKPREKMLAHGKKSLSKAELVAILLNSGVPGKNAVEVAKEILSKTDGNLTRLARMEMSDFKIFPGVGEAKAIRIMAALELGWRMTQERDDQKEIYIKNSNDLFRSIYPKIIDQPTEEFWAIYLNVRNKVIETKQISTGGLTQTSVDLRVIFKHALKVNAVSLAVAHNHPSGSLKPSRQDNDLTQQLLHAGEIMHIPLIDHIIVGITSNGKADYYSYLDDDKLK